MHSEVRNAHALHGSLRNDVPPPRCLWTSSSVRGIDDGSLSSFQGRSSSASSFHAFLLQAIDGIDLDLHSITLQDPTLGTDATGGGRARQCELGGTRGGDQSFEVLKCGGLHLVLTEVVPVGSGVEEKGVLVL